MYVCVYIDTHTYTHTQQNRPICVWSHARTVDMRPPGFSILFARHVARKRNLLGAFTKLCVRTTLYRARNKMPHVSRFLSFVHCGRLSVSRIHSTWRKSVIPSRIADDRVFASVQLSLPGASKFHRCLLPPPPASLPLALLFDLPKSTTPLSFSWRALNAITSLIIADVNNRRLATRGETRRIWKLKRPTGEDVPLTPLFLSLSRHRERRERVRLALPSSL